MEPLRQLVIIEANAGLDFYNRFGNFFNSWSTAPIVVSNSKSFKPQSGNVPELVFYSTLRFTKKDAAAITHLCTGLPKSWIVVVAAQVNEAGTLQALQSGAADCVAEDAFTSFYLQKQVLQARRHHQLYEQMRRAEQRLAACSENTPGVAIQWLNSRGEVVFWNRHSAELYEWPATEALGKTLSQLMLKPKAAAIFQQHVAQVTADMKQVVLAEFAYETRSGKQGHCRSTLFTIPAAQDEVLLVCMDVDITDLIQVKNKLKSSEGKYQRLTEQQADAIAIFDRKGLILDANSSASRLLQYSREEFKHTNLLQILLTEELLQHPLDLDLLDKGENTIKQRNMRRKDGSLVETEVHATAIAEGVYLASVRDLTERLQVQHQLEKEIQLSHSIINSLPGLFYLFQQGVGYLRWNKLFETISGYNAAELKQMQPIDFFSSAEKPMIEKAIDIVFEKGEHAVEAHLLTKDGRSVPYYFTGRAITYDGAPAFLGTGIDLSAVRVLEQALANEKIAAQKRMMQAMIAAGEQEKAKLGRELHDNITQILSVVRMYLVILNSGEVTPGITLSKTLELLSTAIDEIRNLSHRLAASYRFEAGLAHSLEEMLAPLRSAAGIQVTTSLPPKLDSRTSAEQKLALYRIVQEGVNNIVKYAKAKSLQLSITIAYSELHLVLTDDGVGFDTSIASKGLGLSNITNRAEALEGSVQIQSTPGKGTQLHVWFPLKGAKN